MKTPSGKGILELLFFVLALLAFLPALSACFSPWQGDYGYIHIAPAGQERTLAPGSEEGPALRFHVVLSGPRGRITREFGPGGGTMQLSKGSYQITVKAYNGEPRLRGIREQTIAVQPGKTTLVTLKPVVGIRNAAEFQAAFDDTSPFYAKYCDPSHVENVLVIENDMTYTVTGNAVASGSANTSYTVMAETGKTLTIARKTTSPHNNGSLMYAYKTLTLGSGAAGFEGEIVLDGGKNNLSSADVSNSLIYINSGCTLIMNPGVTLKNNRYGGASGGGAIQSAGTFIMNGGIISGNEAVDTSRGGGAIYVTAGGALTIKGGEITGNKHEPTSGTASGGAIFIDAGTAVISGPVEIRGNYAIAPSGFNSARGGAIAVGSTVPTTVVSMTGGRISGNYAQGPIASGGGVFINISGSYFAMSGGSIEGNFAEGTTGGASYMARGGGVYAAGGRFDLFAGAISGNKAFQSAAPGPVFGGGVYVEGGGQLLIRDGGRISGNRVEGAGSPYTAYGGGVATEGPVTMSGGAVSGNIVNAAVSGDGGGGMFVATGSVVTMTGGVIGGDNSPVNGNKAVASGCDVVAGGVLVKGGSFTMSGTAAIRGNLADGSANHSDGGGVYLNTGTFTMSGGTISGNTALSMGSRAYGGGIFYSGSGTITLSSGSITGNTVNGGFSSGGGIYAATDPGVTTAIITGNYYEGTLVPSPGSGEPDWSW